MIAALTLAVIRLLALLTLNLGPIAVAPAHAEPTRLWSAPFVGDASSSDRIIVEGEGRGAAFAPRAARAVTSAAEPANPSALPIAGSIIPQLLIKTFGKDERVVAARRSDLIEIACAAGANIAGVALESSTPAPRGARLKLRLRAEGSADFAAAISALAAEPQMTAPIAVGMSEFDGPNALSRSDGFGVTILCPPHAAELRILSIELAAADARATEKSAWAWRPALWRDDPAKLIAAAAGIGARRLFVAVDIADGALQDSEKFAAFVAQARAAGIMVAIVEGDAGMSLPPGRAVALARLGAIRAYQGAAAPEARIAGLQYDIEPYLLREYLFEPEAVTRGWADTIRALRAATGMELEFVLPFWLASEPHAARHVLPVLREAADRIAIMAYRTRIAAISAAAQPLLAWASESGLRTRVAIEMGPLADETSQIFVRNREGALCVELAADGRRRVALFDGACGSVAGDRYAFSHETVAPAAHVSFLGDRKRFLTAAMEAERLFSAWPVFDGMALHGAID